MPRTDKMVVQLWSKGKRDSQGYAVDKFCLWDLLWKVTTVIACTADLF